MAQVLPRERKADITTDRDVRRQDVRNAGSTVGELSGTVTCYIQGYGERFEFFGILSERLVDGAFPVAEDSVGEQGERCMV